MREYYNKGEAYFALIPTDGRIRKVTLNITEFRSSLSIANVDEYDLKRIRKFPKISEDHYLEQIRLIYQMF